MSEHKGGNSRVFILALSVADLVYCTETNTIHSVVSVPQSESHGPR